MIKEYIDSHTELIAPLHKDYSLKFWELSLTGDEQLEKALIESKERYLKIYNNHEEFRQIRQWISTNPPLDEIDARQLKLIHDAFVPHQIQPDVLRDIVERETQIENQSNTFRAKFEGGEATDNELREILRTETNVTRRRATWEATKQVGQEIAPRLLELVAIR